MLPKNFNIIIKFVLFDDVIYILKMAVNLYEYLRIFCATGLKLMVSRWGCVGVNVERGQQWIVVRNVCGFGVPLD